MQQKISSSGIKKYLPIIFFASIVLLISIYALLYFHQTVSASSDAPGTQGASPENQALAKTPTETDSPETMPRTETEELPTEKDRPDTEWLFPPADEYDFSQPVPLAKAVDFNYFDDAIFIGDSRTVGFTICTGIAGAGSYACKALTVEKAFSQAVIKKDSENVTVIEAIQTTDFEKAYIMLGLNELGWKYNSVFVNKYQQLLDEIKTANPDAIIYLQSILPVGEEVSSTHYCISNEKIREYNDLIQTLASENQAYYVNVAEAIALPDGSLPSDAASDGIHLNKEYCMRWLEYLQTHTVSPEIYFEQN